MASARKNMIPAEANHVRPLVSQGSFDHQWSAPSGAKLVAGDLAKPATLPSHKSPSPTNAAAPRPMYHRSESPFPGVVKPAARRMHNSQATPNKIQVQRGHWSAVVPTRARINR